MAFQDLEQDVAAIFGEHTSDRLEAIRLESEAKLYGKRSRVGRHGYEPPVKALPPHVCCAVCREPCGTAEGLHSHFNWSHPRLALAYRPHTQAAARQREAERAKLVRNLARAERQLSAARELTTSCEAEVARLAAKLAASK